MRSLYSMFPAQMARVAAPRTALRLDSKSPTSLRNLYNLPHPTDPKWLKFSPDESWVLVITCGNKNPAIHLLDIQPFVNWTKSSLTLAYCVYLYWTIPLGVGGLRGGAPLDWGNLRKREHFQQLDVSYILLLTESFTRLIDNFLRNHYMPSSKLGARQWVAR